MRVRTAPLRQFLKRIEAGKSLGGSAAPAADDEWGVVKVSAMTWGRFRPSENKRVDKAFANPAYEIKTGDLLLSRANTAAYVGACVVVASCPRRLMLSDKSLRLVPDEGVDVCWLHLMLSSPQVREAISRKATGTKDSMRNISQSNLLDIELPIVRFDEQRRIVDILEDHLSRLDAAARYLHAARAHQARSIDGLLAAEYAAQADGSTARLPLVEGVDDSTLPPLLADWSWRRLGDIAEVVGGVTKDAKRQSDPSLVEVPYLRVANVQRGRLDLATVTTIRVPPGTAETLRLRDGDVLLNEGGDRDKLGRGWVWQEQIEDCIHQNHVFRARVRDNAIRPDLLSMAANTIGGRWCQRNGAQSVNLASISLRKIRLMPVPVPPREQQDAIAARITERRAAGEQLGTALAGADRRQAALRRALLAAAFTGRLTGRSSDLDLAEDMAGVDAPALSAPDVSLMP